MKQAQIDNAWQGPRQCRDCGIRHLVLFAELQHEDFSLIHEPIDEPRFDVGDPLYRAGDPPTHVFTIREGLVKLVQYLPDGHHRIVRLLAQGDLAGKEAIVGQPQGHEAIVLEPVSACRIPVSVIKELERSTPRLHEQLMTRWQRALSTADAWLTELSTGPARARVAHLIIWLIQSCHQDDFYLPSREDMGAMLGLTTETASRVMAEFRRQGLVRILDNNRATADIAALSNI